MPLARARSPIVLPRFRYPERSDGESGSGAGFA
jgi:hypothetical protein